MLLDNSERSPLKAIDFGLAVPFDPEALPRSDLGLEGTPWWVRGTLLRAGGAHAPARAATTAAAAACSLVLARDPLP
jgi:calcium-dependent protein kinase